MLRRAGLNLVQHGDRGGERVGQLLLRRRARLLQVVGTDVHGIEFRRRVAAPDDHIADHLQAGLGRIDVGASGQVLLDQVVLSGALQRLQVGVLLLRQRHIERQHPGRCGVDGHGGVHPLQRDLIEQRSHVAQMTDRHAHLAHLAPRERMVGVIAGLSRQVEGDGQARLALFQVRAIEAVRRRRRRMSGIGAEDPRRVPPRG